MKLTEEDVAELTKRKYDFDAIGACVAQHTKDRSSIADISLDLFYDKDGNPFAYIILRWEGKNGGFEARNATGNSLNADIKAMAELLNGGYYSECAKYEERKKGSTKI